MLGGRSRKNLAIFRDERVFAIQADETPEPLAESARTIFHLIRQVSISRPLDLDIKEIASSLDNYYALNPIGHSASSRRYNFEGYLTYVSALGGALAYFQLLRSGIIESVEACSFEGCLPDGRKFICEGSLEEGIIKSLESYLKLYRKLEIPPPIFVCLTLLGFKDYSLPPVIGAYSFENRQKIGRDILRFPERVIEDYGERADSIMKPVFDALWNAGGHSEDPYYGHDGVWKSPC